MPIKIKCTNPNCGKILNAPDTLAGKKANCPSCKTTLTVPAATAPAAAAPAPAPARPAAAKRVPAAPYPVARKAAPPPEPPSPPPAETPPPSAEEAERLAASLLADEPKPEDAAPTEFIEFTCQWCDELVKVDAALGGKQTPCPNPECKRITKVPVPADPKKADWRNAPKKPVGARMDAQAAPEGAWGTATDRGLVSKESLEEAGALPERKEPVGVRTWIARGMMAAAALVLLIGGTLFAFRYFGGKREAALVEKALAAVNGEKATLAGHEAGALHRYVAEYHLRRKEPGAALPEKGDAGAVAEFSKARAKLTGQGEVNAEGDVLLIDLALAQLALGSSDKKELEERRRLPWRETVKEVARTLNAISREEKQPDDARNEGIRQVTRRLPRKEGNFTEDLVRQLTDLSQPMAVVGLEMMREGKPEAARALLDQVLPLYKAEPKRPAGEAKPPEKGSGRPLTVEVVALAYALGKGQELKEEKSDRYAIEVGKAVAAAFKSPKDARDMAQKLPTATDKAEALVGIADVLADETEARTTLEAAIAIAKQGAVRSPWPLARMVRRGIELSMDEASLLETANAIPAASGLRGWAQLQLFREQLKKKKDAAEESMADMVDKESLSHRLARVELSRHNTARDSSAAKAVDGWAEALKPYGYIGAAMGLQGKD